MLPVLLLIFRVRLFAHCICVYSFSLNKLKSYFGHFVYPEKVKTSENGR